MQSCAMNAKSRIILKLPKSMVTWLEMGKTNLSRLDLLGTVFQSLQSLPFSEFGRFGITNQTHPYILGNIEVHQKKLQANKF